MENATRSYPAPSPAPSTTDDEEESATSLLVPLSVVPPPSKRVKVHVQTINNTTSNANDDRSLRISVDPIAAVARKTLHTNTDHDNTPEEESSINGPETLTLARNDARNDATVSNVSSYPSHLSLSDFNTDILCRITSFLDPVSLLMGLGITNCLFHWLCQQNRAGWDDLCEQLWETKCHVAAPARRESLKYEK